MDILSFIVLVVTGFTACAAFGSYAFVHPVIRGLPPPHHLYVEQGLLRTFGRVMPVLMTLCVVISISYAFAGNTVGGPTQIARWLAAGSFVLALIFTLIFNVPINLATGRWDATNPPADWRAVRNRWEFFQGLRPWLLLLGFVLLCLAIAL